MESVQAALGQFGSPPQVTWRGRVYVVGFPTQKAKAALERLAAAAAARAVEDLRDVLPPDQYRRAVDRVWERIAAREYATWGPGWREIVFTPAGAALQLLALLHPAHPDLTPDDAEAMMRECEVQVGAALRAVYPPFFELLAAGTAIPPGVMADLRDGLERAFPAAPSTTPSAA